MFNRIFARNVTFKEFIEAAKSGGDAGLATVNRYIAIHRNNLSAINALGQDGYSALICAAINGRANIVTALLAIEGIALNATDQYGNTALICAAHNGHTSVVAALLAKDGIAINVANQNGCTALIWAAIKGHANIVISLLAKDGIAINSANQDGITALSGAVTKDHANIVIAILAKDDIAINAIDQYGNTVLILAAQNGLANIVTALLAKEGIAINAANRAGNTALIMAAIKGYANVVTALLPRLSLEEITYENTWHLTAAQEALVNGNRDLSARIVARAQVLRAGLASGSLPHSHSLEEKVSSRVVAAPLAPQERLERIYFTGEVPVTLVCPIGADGRLMRDPITVESGKTFERKNLKMWSLEKLDPVTRTFPCPLTRKPIHERELNNDPTTFVKDAIDAFVKNEEEKDAKEKIDVKDVVAKLVQKIEIQDRLLHSSKDESKQEEKIRPADERHDYILLPSMSLSMASDQRNFPAENLLDRSDAIFRVNSVENNQSSSSSSVHVQKPETERMLAARRRLEFFASQRINKASNDATILLPDRSVASAGIQQRAA